MKEQIPIKINSKSGQQIRQLHRSILIEKHKREKLTAHELSLNEYIYYFSLVDKNVNIFSFYCKKFNLNECKY